MYYCCFEFEKAKNDFDIVLSKFKSDKTSYNIAYRGYAMLYALTNNNLAISYCTKSIKKSPKFFYGYILRVFCYLIKGDFKNALYDFGMAYKLKPTSAEAIAFYAVALSISDKNKINESRELIEKAFDYDKNYIMLYACRARISLEMLKVSDEKYSDSILADFRILHDSNKITNELTPHEFLFGGYVWYIEYLLYIGDDNALKFAYELFSQAREKFHNIGIISYYLGKYYDLKHNEKASNREYKKAEELGYIT
ncbi:MAG: hypothetical protein FWG90_00195 [Oscillospiraceae bacterium]|nr:hypothetical protein [Oscillospiraceae bacterium]